ncbi:HepT-like ribonuclease domain-containing protein [Marinoscillum furvescens]|uniref:Uncharacterized protein with HEPN domain n=1 Tax=Marinoscillum furvescens DSM 4134 TaxID=1122208 RepID=A0A3D9L657_MARFU|nr:HepT-like ribonuclease domain-containing protein [Marinoscillum furvescens]REE00077.1 uncharacterized protein with HEPN domain [Marinoscillum furvescens DSM 4134]
MEKQEITQHLNQIVSNIAAIKSAVSGRTLEEFRKEEQTKEAVYEYLQEIGQIAHEVSEHATDELVNSLSMAQLSNLRNARYHQEAELHHQNTWNLIHNDLEAIADEIEATIGELQS